jgi:hypothetical protein
LGEVSKATDDATDVFGRTFAYPALIEVLLDIDRHLLFVAVSTERATEQMLCA